MIKYVLFDLDDTILDFHKAEAIALTRALSEMGVAPTPQTIARYSAINKSQWELLEEKKLTRPQVLIRRFDILFGELGVHVSSQETQRRYETYLAMGHHFIPGAPELLAELVTKYRLFLVSNGTAPVQAGRIKSSGIETYFEKIFISEAVGADKPQKLFFDRCFAQIPDFCPEEAIIIGDSLTSDIRGGNNAGITTCWFNPKGLPRREGIVVDHEIRALSELPPLLERL